jgi:hypothetical protein
LNQIRQGLISLLFLFSLSYINSKKYYLYNIVGFFIQSGAIIFIIFSLIKKYFSNPKFVFVLLFISFFLTKYITGDSLFGFFPESSKVLFYLKDERFNYTRELLKDVTFFKCIIILFLMSIKYSSLKKMWGYFTLLYSSYAFGIFCLIFFHNIALISGRVSTLLFTVEPILIYYLLRNYSSHRSIHLSYLLVILICIITLYMNINSENSPVTTYKSIFIK